MSFVNFGNIGMDAMRRRAIEEEKKRQAEAAAKKQAEAAAADQARMDTESADRGPGYRALAQSKYEKKAGVTPPGYEGIRDVKTGALLDQYKSDPYAGDAMKALKEQAFSQGDSPWAKMQIQRQALEEGQARDQAAKSSAQGIAQAQANMMRTGGISSGARTLMANQGAKDLMRSKQNVAAQGMADRLNIQGQDIQRKDDLMRKLGDQETAAGEANIGRTMGDVSQSNLFNANRYKELMAAWGAEQTANAQRAAAGGGGKK